MQNPALSAPRGGAGVFRSVSKTHILPGSAGPPPYKLGNICVARSTPTGRPFSDFLERSEPAPSQDNNGDSAALTPEEKAEQLIQRASSVLEMAQAALEDVRKREPSDSRYRRSGAGIVTGAVVVSKAGDEKELSTLAAAARPSSRPAITSLPLAWESDGNETDDEDDGPSLPFASSPPPSAAVGGSSGARLTPSSGGDIGGGRSDSFEGGGSSSSPSSGSWAPAGLDSWFGGKVDTGGVTLRPSAVTPTGRGGAGIAVMDRPDLPTSLEFAPPEAPAESGAAEIFPASLAMRFQSEVPSEPAAAEPAFAAAPAAGAAAPQGDWTRKSGEEFGPDGYWYRWTEVEGKDASGSVVWSERWWEASDWRGMKELGAEKWGSNARGDAWRESWRESIGFDEATRQPTVERSAHKWARAAGGREWEEKWGESYWSGGKADKWADKWGKEGNEVWHEKWGEQYDGAGGCLKYTDRWAERGSPYHESPDKWGDKWEETFKDGRGTKRGETWNETGGHKYQRWWGENHEGQGVVQKFGSSSTGEHWDVTEGMDTYYNPIPHFGYDLALAHSPQLRGVPSLPRDDALNNSGGGGSGGKGGGGDGGEEEGGGKKKGGKKGGGGGGKKGGGGLASLLFG